MAEIYGTIGILPMGDEWNAAVQYDLLNLVSYDGSSYVAHTKPPVGTLPTNTAYWQTSAQGTSKATADSVGTVKPDGVTTEVSADGVLSAKIATQSTAGMVKGSPGITVGTGGAIDVNTAFTQATELANIIAGEAIAQVLGKISKAIATTMNLDQNALLKNMLTNMDANDQNKINTAAYVHTLTERIGMSTELTAGANLTAALNALNSNLSNLSPRVSNKGEYSGDLNSIPLAANILTIYRAANTCTNIPVVAHGIVETMYIDSVSYAIQRFTSIEAIPRIWLRTKINGTWNSWIPNSDYETGTVIVTANTGTASVTFKIPFAGNPSVHLTAIGSNAGAAISFKVSSISATGFTFICRSMTSGSNTLDIPTADMNVMWTASRK